MHFENGHECIIRGGGLQVQVGKGGMWVGGEGIFPVAILAWSFWWGNFVWRHVTDTKIEVADYHKQ